MLFAITAFLVACQSSPRSDTPSHTGSASSGKAAEAGYRSLFNGRDLSGWKLRKPDGPASWTVRNGELINTVKPGEHGTDLVTEEKFWNFTVHYEYKVPAGANSGFYLRGRHELQIFDDYAKGVPAKNGNGSIYNHTAPSVFASKPAGEWQTVDATMIGNRITVVLNGKTIHQDVVCERPTGSEIDNKVNEPGPLFLQGDHGSVAFRNVRIKVLPN